MSNLFDWYKGSFLEDTVDALSSDKAKNLIDIGATGFNIYNTYENNKLAKDAYDRTINYYDTNDTYADNAFSSTFSNNNKKKKKLSSYYSSTQQG